MPGNAGDITIMLPKVADGDPAVVERLLALVYDELRALAQSHLNHERPDHTLQATAIVHEAYLRLIGAAPLGLRDRTHFFALAAQAIRRVLIDYARSHRRMKRGGGAGRISLESTPGLAVPQRIDLIALHDALDRLGEIEPRYARIVEMRFFGGMTVDEVAVALDVNTRTVVRDWRIARAWLFRELGADAEHSADGPSSSQPNEEREQ